MAIAPGDVFLATPGWRQTRRMALAAFPPADLFQAATTGCCLSPEWSANWSAPGIELRPPRARTLSRGGVRRPRRDAEHSAIRRDGHRRDRSQRAGLSDTRHVIGGRQDHSRGRRPARAAHAGPYDRGRPQGNRHCIVRRLRNTRISGRRRFSTALISAFRQLFRRVARISEIFFKSSISASRYRPMPWWWNAPAIRSLPTRPSFFAV